MRTFPSICTALLLFSSYAALSQTAKDSLQAIKLLQEIEKRNQSLKTLSYTSHYRQVDSDMDDSAFVATGQVWLSTVSTDTIFGFVFHTSGKDKRENFDYYYDGQQSYELRHGSKTVTMINPYAFPNGLNNPAKARTALIPMQEYLTDKHLVKTLLQQNPSVKLSANNDDYIIQLDYAANKAGASMTRWITISKKDKLIKQVKRTVLWNGTTQSSVHTIDNIKMNDRSIADSIPLSRSFENYTINELKRERSNAPDPALAFKGKPAANFSYASFSGPQVKLSELKGKYVLLDFWESWCGYCILNIPNVQKLHEQYGPKGLAVIGVTTENKTQIQKLIERNHITYTTLNADTVILSNYKVEARPTYVLIAPDGNIMEYAPGDFEKVTDAIRKALGPKELPEDMIRFFEGKWHGKGQFASGKAIEADIEFKLLLDDKWLRSEHTDVAPNKYKSVSMWGWDKNENKVVAYVFDNFSGHRKFTSEGWIDSKLLLIYQDGKMFQRFTYEKQSATAFKMSYEVSNDGKEWRMIDWLLFEK